MFDVRLTLSIDDDVLEAAKELAAIRGQSIGEVVSELARRSLTAPGSARRARTGVPLPPGRRAGDFRSGAPAGGGGPLRRFLLDVNVLIALLDPAHIQHETAHVWFEREGRAVWASCPLTQNGVLRVVGHRAYPSLRGGPAADAPLRAAMTAMAEHEFWPDEVSLLDAARVDLAGLLSAMRVTDTYLLALAAAHGGRLATLDARLRPEGVRGGVAALCRIHPGTE
ncbi:MAG: TA system VapC family ribonuclease toxin [Terriglobales bacterium]